VYSRYQSALVFEIGGNDGPIGLLGTKPKAVAVLWLSDLVDDEDTEVSLDILESKEPDKLRQNHINEFTAKHHDFKVVGNLKFHVKLDSGLDPDHEQVAAERGQSMRHAYDAYDRVVRIAFLTKSRRLLVGEELKPSTTRRVRQRLQTRMPMRETTGW
jgi:hypothetical protein